MSYLNIALNFLQSQLVLVNNYSFVSVLYNVQGTLVGINVNNNYIQFLLPNLVAEDSTSIRRL